MVKRESCVQVFLCSNPSAQGPHITIKKRNIYIYIYIYIYCQTNNWKSLQWKQNLWKKKFVFCRINALLFRTRVCKQSCWNIVLHVQWSITCIYLNKVWEYNSNSSYDPISCALVWAAKCSSIGSPITKQKVLKCPINKNSKRTQSNCLYALSLHS
jgi:hypothetical protein